MASYSESTKGEMLVVLRMITLVLQKGRKTVERMKK